MVLKFRIGRMQTAELRTGQAGSYAETDMPPARRYSKPPPRPNGGGGAVLGVLLLIGAGPAWGDLADLYLKNGTRLRGDVTETESEVILRNAAGETRFPRSAVEKIEYITPPRPVDEEYHERARALQPLDIEGHFALAEWARDKKRYDLVRRQCKYILGLDPGHASARLLLEEAETRLAEQAQLQGEEGAAPPRPPPRPAGIAAPALLKERDINRLRLYELRLDGRPEEIPVRFLKVRGEPDLESLVRAEIENLPDADPDWQRTLERGRPHEKLQLIVRHTAMKFADRIEVRSDPEVFQVFRRRVLPLVLRGCARSGCHSGATAQAFRFPSGSPFSDSYAYTTFLLLDQTHTRSGPLIRRDLPEQSVLLAYLLPSTHTDKAHPPVRGGRLHPILRGRRDPDYEVLLEWIGRLRVPHPTYELDYTWPDWLRTAPRTATQPESVPADHPAGDQQP
jgi:hypothetical protein